MMHRTHRNPRPEPGRVRGAGLLVRPGRILALVMMVVAAMMVTALPQFSSATPAHPVTSHIRQVGLVKSSVAALAALRSATGSVRHTPGVPDPILTARAAAVTPAQDVAGAVTVVGVTWPKGAASAKDTYQIRTLTGATWSQWQMLDAAQGDGPDRAEAATATAGTSPYVVTGASKYEVRTLTTNAKVSALATVHAVDPGTSNADTLAQAPGAAAAATTKPTIYTRADWGADEALRRAAPAYGQVQLGFVHHTDSANTYTAADVPAMIRGIYAYHVQTLGWNDIGYNFLIDRFSRTWEGRYGGMDQAVVGAQTLNFNSVSTGVSAIGNFDIAAVPQPVTDAFKRIFAWKFSLAGIPATGTVLVNGTILQRVSGHRDAFATLCPGQYLYAKLPEIRAGAAAMMGSVPTAPTGVLATAANARALVSWTAPSSDGGSAITGYTVTATPGGESAITTGTTTALVSGLTNGTSYTFTVAATNGVGTSPTSTPSTATIPSLTGSGFTGTAPARVLDTRIALGTPKAAKVRAGHALTLTVPGLPTGTTAVALNVTITGPTAAGNLTVYPGGQPLPHASNLNYLPGQTIPNMVLVPLGPGNTVTFNNSAGTVNVIADVLGYYTTGTGAGFTGTAPARVLDTRIALGTPKAAKVRAGHALTLTVPRLPTGTTAVALNVTITGPTAAGNLTVYPGGQPLPHASNLNYLPGQTIPNMVLVPLGPGNTVTFNNSAGTVNVIADVLGYYAS